MQNIRQGPPLLPTPPPPPPPLQFVHPSWQQQFGQYHIPSDHFQRFFQPMVASPPPRNVVPNQGDSGQYQSYQPQPQPQAPTSTPNVNADQEYWCGECAPGTCLKPSPTSTAPGWTNSHNWTSLLFQYPSSTESGGLNTDPEEVELRISPACQVNIQRNC